MVYKIILAERKIKVYKIKETVKICKTILGGHLCLLSPWLLGLLTVNQRQACLGGLFHAVYNKEQNLDTPLHFIVKRIVSWMGEASQVVRSDQKRKRQFEILWISYFGFH